MTVNASLLKLLLIKKESAMAQVSSWSFHPKETRIISFMLRMAEGWFGT